MAIATANANKLNDFLFGKTTYTPNTTYYIGLSTTTIKADGSGIKEPVGAGYSRVAVTNNKTSFTNSSGGILSNKIQIEFPESTSDWGTVTDVFISDAASGGNMLYFDKLTASRIVQPNTILLFDVGAMKIQIV